MKGDESERENRKSEYSTRFQIKDLSSLMTFMRFNDFEHDPHAVVQGCEPERTPAGSIANRLDLSEPESKCAFSEHDWMVGHRGVMGLMEAIVSCHHNFIILAL